ncbi:replication initiator [Nonomuraea roseoviolacea]|uniref:replication initiator n=1 Tax=Nonomuraea roseoviolacea TaxID=103837 RepID=UPI0031CEAD51
MRARTSRPGPQGRPRPEDRKRRVSRSPKPRDTGLRGGKSVPEEVSQHPRVFAAFTAPSFGAVHAHRQRAGQTLPCRPRPGRPVCEHGRPQGCVLRHHRDDAQVGQPMCVDCYDYIGAVLWNAHAGALWREFTKTMPNVLAGLLGCTRKDLRRTVRLSYAKVAEYQARGLVHFHAVIRLDGPDGPSDRPPGHITVELLDQAIRQTAVRVTIQAPDELRSAMLRWGDQLDVRPVYVSTELDGMSDQRVARYVAKYATKGAESAGTVDRPIRQPWEIARLPVAEHARRMIYTCFSLAELAEYKGLRLRQWAHMLGYRGHFSTKSRHYSIRLADLRQARAGYRSEQARLLAGLPSPAETVTVAEWRYAGSGLRNGEPFWAELARQRIATARHIARERDKQIACPSPEPE